MGLFDQIRKNRAEILRIAEIVTENGLNKYVRDRVLSEAVPL